MTDTDIPPETAPEAPKQVEMPFAIVHGEAMLELPQDLYIPPDALEVILEAFEGPLDLLLYLIKRQNLDVLDIPVAEITRQYMDYIGLMQELRLEVAAEYLVMAAMLAEIKSRMLLPRPVETDSDEDDPRAELVRRLQEYERYKKAAEDIDGMPRLQRDIFPAEAVAPERQVINQQPDIDLRELLLAFKEVMARADMFSHHHVQMEALSVRERMSAVLSSVNADRFSEFTHLFTVEEGRMGVVVTFLAILELLKESLIEMIQAEPYAPIYVKAAGGQGSAEVPEPTADAGA
ncbi:segregation and condensation protein A [Thiohalobacter thiocyanaticus]|uniref:Segregation and condensation protein A n=1 Tax=Thiohalobacter thiocyanaticus TaxID=585455 RepID=A0A426QME4_9GAMM|nr:ScpA family protein [Thiohalobacter thiocyanaticus]RRQ22931.1 segregation/condensation protein A [Thiohalobacter thiocyanaticus]